VLRAATSHLEHQRLEAINQGDAAVTDEVFARDCVRRLIYHASVTRLGRGAEAVKRRISDWQAAFPNWRFTVEDMLAEGDLVMTRCTVRGTHQGELFSLPPTGREVAYTEILLSRVAEGRIVEQSVLVDRLGLLQELGVLPGTGEILQQARAS
jgi:predicted ester cyclase